MTSLNHTGGLRPGARLRIEVCDGCGRATRDAEKDIQELLKGGYRSCCPERKMLAYEAQIVCAIGG
ncbi:hypothetical protein [Rhizobium phage RHph_X2_26]|nr:hypothetical protein [Rhizobium phage RHph_X2_26]